MLSIIIPTLNESKSGYLRKILTAYSQIENIEIICVDGGSTDNTVEVILNANASKRGGVNVLLIQTDICSRAGRLNEGIKAAHFDMVLLNHPRSIIEQQGIAYLMSNSINIEWGVFTHKFDHKHPLLSFTSWYSNYVRGDMRQIYYLDHCIFAKKSMFEQIGLVPDIDIFEDTELCLLLRQFGKARRLSAISKTSAIRFVSKNIYRQAFMNQSLKWQYYFNRSDKVMNKRYETGFELNSKYSKDQTVHNDKNK